VSLIQFLHFLSFFVFCVLFNYVSDSHREKRKERKKMKALLFFGESHNVDVFFEPRFFFTAKCLVAFFVFFELGPK
jgi:hypothetical protein